MKTNFCCVEPLRGVLLLLCTPTLIHQRSVAVLWLSDSVALDRAPLAGPSV